MHKERDLAAIKARARVRAKERAKEDERYLKEHFRQDIGFLASSFGNKSEKIQEATKIALREVEARKKEQEKKRRVQTLTQKPPVALSPVFPCVVTDSVQEEVASFYQHYQKQSAEDSVLGKCDKEKATDPYIKVEPSLVVKKEKSALSGQRSEPVKTNGSTCAHQNSHIL